MGASASKFRSTEIFAAGIGGCLPRYSEPSRPCSSPVTAANKIERGGADGGGPGMREFQQNSAAGAVVDRAVVDVVALRAVSMPR